MTDPALQRFVDLVRRELGAKDVVLAEELAPPPPQEGVRPTILTAYLHDGRRVDALFDAPPPQPMVRRFEMLVHAFDAALSSKAEPPKRPTPASLRDELRALANRAGAVDALVIDAHSPVVWGSVSERPLAVEAAHVQPMTDNVRDAVRVLHESHRDLVAALRGTPGGNDLDDDDDHDGPSDDAEARSTGEPPAPPAARAIDEVRRLPAIESLHKGGHLSYVVRETDYGCLARSFAAIYVLVLVFDRSFDEIRAERAIRDSLHKIERLVLALPPLDPQPMGQVMALRRRRR